MYKLFLFKKKTRRCFWWQNIETELDLNCSCWSNSFLRYTVQRNIFCNSWCNNNRDIKDNKQCKIIVKIHSSFIQKNSDKYFPPWKRRSPRLSSILWFVFICPFLYASFLSQINTEDFSVSFAYRPKSSLMPLIKKCSVNIDLQIFYWDVFFYIAHFEK